MKAQEIELLGNEVTSGDYVVSNEFAEIADEDVLRANFYALLGSLLSAVPNAEAIAQISEFNADDTALGQALGALGAAARASKGGDIDDEYHALFIGVGGGELNPYGSFYLTGFMYEKPLAELRDDMTELGIAPADDIVDPEDHIASLCEMMAGLITGAFGEPADISAQQAFFDSHIGSWAGRFFEDLERSERSAFYRPLGTVGRLFLEIEKEAFKMAS